MTNWGQIFSIIGILIGLTLFLYIIPMFRHKPSDYTVPPLMKKTGENNHPDQPRQCPVCHHVLRPEDAVYTVTYKGEPEDKTFVKGCDYCFDPKTGKKREK